MRINKYISLHYEVSRRKADAIIESGDVSVNGEVASLGQDVADEDDIHVRGMEKSDRAGAEKIVIALHKPVGYITTTDRSRMDTVLDLVKIDERLFPVGRLDVGSSGLLLLTNDGDLAHHLMHPKFEHEKEYLVSVDRPLTDQDFADLRNGVVIDGRKTFPAVVIPEGDTRFRITIHEGRNRQIRRMCEAIDVGVTELKRIRIDSLVLGTLKPGSWRGLSEAEVQKLLSANQ